MADLWLCVCISDGGEEGVFVCVIKLIWDTISDRAHNAEGDFQFCCRNDTAKAITVFFSIQSLWLVMKWTVDLQHISCCCCCCGEHWGKKASQWEQWMVWLAHILNEMRLSTTIMVIGTKWCHWTDLKRMMWWQNCLIAMC